MKKLRIFVYLIIVLAITLLFGCSPDNEGAINPDQTTISGELTITSTATATRTTTLTRTPTHTFTPTPTSTRTPRPTRTPTQAPSQTGTAIPLGTLTATPMQSSSGPFQSILNLEGFPIGLVQDLYFIDDHSVILSGTFGLVKVDLYTKHSEITRFNDTVLGIDPSGRAWVLSSDGGSIAAWDGNNWQTYGNQQGWLLPAKLPKTPMIENELLFDSQGGIWWASSVDIRHFNGIRWRVFTATEIGIRLPYRAGVETAFKMAIFPDGSHIWVGSCDWRGNQPIGGGGLRHFDGQRWTSGDFPLTNACITSITIDNDNQVWVAANNELFSSNPNDKIWIRHTPPPLENPTQRYFYIKELILAQDRSIWPLFALTDSSGFERENIRFRYWDNTWEEARRLPALATQDLVFFPNGLVWALEKNSILQYYGGTSWKPIASLDFRANAQDSLGGLWLVTSTVNRPVLWKSNPP